jgi:hypothetical protein
MAVKKARKARKAAPKSKRKAGKKKVASKKRKSTKKKVASKKRKSTKKMTKAQRYAKKHGAPGSAARKKWDKFKAGKKKLAKEIFG